MTVQANKQHYFQRGGIPDNSPITIGSHYRDILHFRRTNLFRWCYRTNTRQLLHCYRAIHTISINRQPRFATGYVAASLTHHSRIDR
jgi:hypothetical protein